MTIRATASCGSRVGAAVFVSLALSACALLGTGRGAFPQPEMIEISGGTFEMGDVFERANSDATPVHPVFVRSFRLSRTEVTYEQYDAFATARGLRLPDDHGRGRGKRAVTDVSWDEARSFCRAAGLRLPTEPEWEYAARSGGRRERYAGVTESADPDDYVRHEDNGVSSATYVGTKRPNGLGLHDMSGNVYEWVGAYYEFYPEPGGEIEWSDLGASAVRIIRGGSFRNPLGMAQTYRRSGTLGTVRSEMIGFRCAGAAG